MPVNDLATVRVVCTQGNQVSINVRHYLLGVVDGLGSSDQAFADLVSSRIAPRMAELLSTSASYDGVAVTIRPLIGAPREVQSTTGATAGLVAGDPLPKQTSGLITFRAASGGRQGRGRMYVAFPGEASNNTLSEPNVDYFDDLNDLGADLIAQFSPGVAPDLDHWDAVLLNRQTGNLRAIVSRQGRFAWATQRRRGDFGRPNQSPLI